MPDSFLPEQVQHSELGRVRKWEFGIGIGCDVMWLCLDSEKALPCPLPFLWVPIRWKWGTGKRQEIGKGGDEEREREGESECVIIGGRVSSELSLAMAAISPSFYSSLLLPCPPVSFPQLGDSFLKFRFSCRIQHGHASTRPKLWDMTGG